MKNFIIILILFLAAAASKVPIDNFLKQFMTNIYFSNPGFESNLDDWKECSGSGAAPTTDVTEASSNLTIERNTTTPLDGSADMKISKPASNEQGKCVFTEFFVPKGHEYSPITQEFLLRSSNITFGDSSDIKIFIANKSNSQVQTPWLNQLGNNGKKVIQWQSGATGTYQLILWTATTNASAWDLYVDSFKSRLSDWVVINSDSDWVSYTPTFTGFGTPTITKAQYRKQGPNIQIQIKATLGTRTSVEGRISLPTGLNMASSIATLEQFGTVAFNAQTSVTYFVLGEPNVNYMTFGFNNATGSGLAKQNGDAIFGNGGVIDLTATIPIQGWTSGVSTVGQWAQNTPVRFKAVKNGGSITLDTTIPSWTSVEEDTVDSFTASTGQYQIKVPGDYKGNVFYQFTAGGTDSCYVAVNGVYQNQRGYSGNSTRTNVPFTLFNLKVGDIISQMCTASKTIASSNDTNWTMERIATPSSFLTIPKVATISHVLAANTAGGSATAGSWRTRALNTLNDPFGIVTSLSSNQFILQPGTYYIEGWANAFAVNRHTSKIRNITASSDAVLGGPAIASGTSPTTQSNSQFAGTVVITVPTTFELQTQVSASQTTTGYGNPGNFGVNEVYSQIKIQKLL